MPKISRKIALTPLLILLTSGCAGEKDRLALESRLRENQSTIRELQEEVKTAQQLLEDQDQELVTLRDSQSRKNGSPGSIVSVSSTSESATAWGSVNSIQIHRMTSGIITDAGQTLVNVVIQPLDKDEELVKVSGQLNVTASRVSDNGSTEVIASREIDITESRKLWTRGLVSSGFHIQMSPTGDVESSGDLLLTAVLSLGGDRTYKTSELFSTDDR